MAAREDFFNLYRHGFVRVALATPALRVGDPAFNARGTVELMRGAAREKALLAVFPELGLSAYSCEDLFHQQALLDGCLDGLDAILKASVDIPVITVVGMPLQVHGMLFNCAVT